MTFKRKAPRPPKPTIDDLMQSGKVITGAKLIENEKVKAKAKEEFERAVQDELSSRNPKRV